MGRHFCASFFGRDSFYRSTSSSVESTEDENAISNLLVDTASVAACFNGSASLFLCLQ